MKILFIGGYFDKNQEKEIIEKTITSVDIAGNRFQDYFIQGFIESHFVSELKILSAPLINTWPNGYKDFYFRGFKEENKSPEYLKYVHFLNIWALRNIFRTKALKKAILKSKFYEKDEEEKVVILYCPHTPFLKAANYIKKLNPTIKTCMIVPDLPQYMNLSDKISIAYKILKKIDIHFFYKECNKIDSFILITDQMKSILKIGERPYKVIECIYGQKNKELLNESQKEMILQSLNLSYECKKIVYTGKLAIKFGLINLIRAFSLINDDNIRLILCGNGDAVDEIQKASAKDKRIIFKGQVSSNVATEICRTATVLINPRQNNEEYTKYSFPSKIFEYLATGLPVISYKLDGMPDIYKDFLYIPESDSIDDLAKMIKYVLDLDKDIASQKTKKALEYLEASRTPIDVANQLVDFLKEV